MLAKMHQEWQEFCGLTLVEHTCIIQTMTAGEPSSIQKIQKLHFYSLSATYTYCKDKFKIEQKK